MNGLIVSRGGRSLPSLCINGSAVEFNDNFRIISIRTDNKILPIHLIKKDVLTNSDRRSNSCNRDRISDDVGSSNGITSSSSNGRIKIAPKRQIRVIRVNRECSVCYQKSSLKTFKCYHSLCYVCMDELRNTFCPMCKVDIIDQLTEIQLEMIQFRQEYDLREQQTIIAEEDRRLAESMSVR